MKHLRILQSMAGLVGLTGVASLTFGGCSEPATEIVAGVSTQIQVPKYIKNVGVLVRVGGSVSFCDLYDVTDGIVTIPGTIGIAPDSDPGGDPIRITYFAMNSDAPQDAVDEFEATCNVPDTGVRIIRRGITKYDPERILFMPLPLKESCNGVLDCEDTETCVGGKCVDANMDPESLATFNPALIFGDTNTCFSGDLCLPEGKLFPANLIDKSDCTYELAIPDDVETAPGNLNVKIVYSTFTSEILDEDPLEGFIIDDPANAKRFRLAPNMCESIVNNPDRDLEIISVAGQVICPPKHPLQPICNGELTDLLAGDQQSLGGLADEGFCTDPTALVQTDSALYVLLDRSKSMQSFFGEEGLQAALDIQLQNPIAEQTRVALGFLPADNNDCTGASSLANPVVDFGTVEEVRVPIANQLGDTGNVLASDPMLFLDAALRPEGAYEALEAELAGVPTNKKALLIATNRDFQPHCGGLDLAALTQLAADAGLSTYVVVLNAPDDAEQFGGNPTVDGEPLVNGGGRFFSAPDEAEQGEAVVRVVNDLGSCVYDKPEASLVESAILSYLNPIDQVRTDITNNPDCREDNPDVDGWALEGDVVRICGAPCEGLRDVLTDVVGAAVVFDAEIPKIPILVSRPCFTGG